MNISLFHFLVGPSKVANHECSMCKDAFLNLSALKNHQIFTHCKTETNNHIAINESSKVLVESKCVPHNKCLSYPNLDVYMCEEEKTYLVAQGYDETSTSFKESIQKGMITTEVSMSNISGPFKCTWMSINQPTTECGEIFPNCCKYSLHHRDKHTKRRKTTGALRCQVCEKLLESTNSPIQNPEVEVFPCHLCGEIFTNSLKLEMHTSVIHNKVKPFKCSICEKCFTQSGGLQQHMRRHTGARPYKCMFCKKRFTQKGGLDQHLRTHTKVKPFKCIVCHKSFSQSVHVQQHMRTHTNIQPFQCNVCGKRFKQLSHHNLHMRGHINITNNNMKGVQIDITDSPNTSML